MAFDRLLNFTVKTKENHGLIMPKGILYIFFTRLFVLFFFPCYTKTKIKNGRSK